MMKKKLKFNVVTRSKIAIVFYYVQVAILMPIFIPTLLMNLLSNSVLDLWKYYKDWYLNKTLQR